MIDNKSNPVNEKPDMESMDPVIEKTSCKIRQWFEKNDDLFFFIIMAILAFWVRLAFIPFKSGDYLINLEKWYNILKNGGFLSFKENFYDYTPMYLYLIWLASYLPVSPEMAIKIISFVFDFVGAFFIALLVKEHYKNHFWTQLSFIVVLFIPTVIINSAIWAQCDFIYTAALLATIYYLIKGNNWAAFIGYGIAFSFKIQAVFLAPLLLFLWLKQKVKLYHFLIVPAVYILTILPCVIAGRPFWDLMLIDFNLTERYPWLTLGFANFYQWIANGNQYFTMYKNAGIILAAAAVIFLCYLSYKSKQKIDEEFILRFSLLSVLIMPFFLPSMHERYYFPAEMISIALAFYRPRYIYIAMTIIMVSFFSYCENLFGAYIIEPKFLAIAMLLVIVKLVYDFIRYLSLEDSKNSVGA